MKICGLSSQDRTNESLKKLASSGSWYFDLAARLLLFLSVKPPKNKTSPPPNDQFVMFYDSMVDRLPRSHPLIDSKAHLRSRHWNNKGNSMEALMLLVAETGARDLVWSIGYIIMNLQFRKQRLLWIEDCLCAEPRWQTKIDHWCAFTTGRIYNWYRFTVQSFEAFSTGFSTTETAQSGRFCDSASSRSFA